MAKCNGLNGQSAFTEVRGYQCSPLIDWSVVTAARELASLGAKTRTITLLTGLSRRRARAICCAVQGGMLPRGNRVRHAGALLRDAVARRDATLLAHLLAFHICERGLPRRLAMVEAFRVLTRTRQAHGGISSLDFDDAYQLIELMENGALLLIPCTRCGCEVVTEADVRCVNGSRGADCPFCPQVNPMTRRRAATRGRRTV